MDPEETQKALPNPEGETREAPSNPGVETKYVAGFAVGSTNLEGTVVPTRRKLTIGGNLPPNIVLVHMETTGARRRGRSSTAKFSADERGRRRKECVDVRWRGHDKFAEEGGDIGFDREGRVTGAVDRKQAMNTLGMEEWRKVRENNKWKVARPNDKLAVGAKVICNRKRLDRTERQKRTYADLLLQGFWQVEGVHCSPTLTRA